MSPADRFNKQLKQEDEVVSLLVSQHHVIQALVAALLKTETLNIGDFRNELLDSLQQIPKSCDVERTLPALWLDTIDGPLEQALH